MKKVIEVENLVKNYGDFQAVSGISFKVNQGEILGLIGPNAAGKTTTLRIIATLLKPTFGKVKVFGFDVKMKPEKVREKISYLAEEAGSYKNLSGKNYLDFIASFYSSDLEEKEKIMKKGFEIAKLGKRMEDKADDYSKGMVRRLLVARSLMIEPELAILDEPTSGLDVLNAREIRGIVKKFAKKGKAVLLSSHNMLEVEFLCDRIILIDKGKIIERGRSEELKKKYNANNIEEVFEKAVGFKRQN